VEIIEAGENCLMSFITCTPPNIIRVTKLKTRGMSSTIGDTYKIHTELQSEYKK
jgi:hypothetical protein